MSADLEEMLEHLKWNLWHGKVDRALEITDELAYALDVENGSRMQATPQAELKAA